MTAAAVDGSPHFSKEKANAYSEYFKMGKTAFSGNQDQIDIDPQAMDALEENEDLPEELVEFSDFIQENLFAIAQEDEQILEELKEKMISVYQFMKSDINENIWDLIESEGVDAESLEYIHSLIVRSIDGVIHMLKNNSLQELEEKEKEGMKYLQSMILAMNKLVVLIENQKISSSERDKINERLRDLENNTRSSMNDDGFEKVDKAII